MEVMEKLKKNQDPKMVYMDMPTVVSLIAIVLIVSLINASFVVKHILFRAQVTGTSMEDTYHNGDDVYISRISDVKRGDVIVFCAPWDNEHLMIKRCVAIPGDSVEIKNDHLYINDTAVKEPYVKNSYVGWSGLLSERLVLKENEYIVLGDNRLISKDSRVFGVVDKSSIKGVVKYSIR